MPCPAFQTSTFPSGGTATVNVVIADFNGDGNPDIAVSNQTTANISVFLGNGAGGFAAAPGSPFATGGLSPDRMTTADFNGDGNQDIAVVNSIGNTVSVLLGNGAGGFALALGSPFASGGLAAGGITSADFNGDGNPDLAVTNQTSGTVVIFFGNGAGGFAAGPVLLGLAGPIEITTADFNGDGNADLAVSNSGGTINVFLGNGAGAFAAAPGSPFASGGMSAGEIISADFNGDGNPDLAVVSSIGSTVSVLLGNGAGGFALASGSPFASGGTSPSGITTGDINCDGIPDLAISNSGSDSVTLFLGVGTGQFSPAIGNPFPSGGQAPTSIASADFNGDGRVDFALTNFTSGTVAVLLNICVPQPICPGNIIVPNDPGLCSAVVNYPPPTIIDTCGVVTSINCLPVSGSIFPVGSTMVTCTAMDAAGNMSDPCGFIITVNDTEPPLITCTADITQGNDFGQCGAVVFFPTPMASDNCGIASVSCSPPSGSFFPVGTTIVTCTAEDINGNSSSCSFNVTVEDLQPPVIICPDDITVFNDPGTNGAFVSFPDPTVIDNCPNASSVCTPASGSFFPPGTTTVTCTATDAAGNISNTCMFNVTVIVDPCRFFSSGVSI